MGQYQNTKGMREPGICWQKCPPSVKTGWRALPKWSNIQSGVDLKSWRNPGRVSRIYHPLTEGSRPFSNAYLLQQARKPRSYASPKLCPLTYLLTHSQG